VSSSALDKVLRLAAPSAATPAAPDAADLVRLAAASIDRLALVLAKKSDPDNDGDNDASAAGDTDKDYAGKGAKRKKPLKKKAKGKTPDDDEDEDDEDDEEGQGDDEMGYARELVLEAMVALSQVEGGELVSLSVLTAAERRSPSAHTISGSTDYPIPDKAHLAAAVARFKQGKLAGHSEEEVKRHILSRARALGETVELASEVPAASVVLSLARGGEALLHMDHGPHTGEHEHPHRVVNVHSHSHFHNNDSRHACGEGMYPGAVY